MRSHLFQYYQRMNTLEVDALVRRMHFCFPATSRALSGAALREIQIWCSSQRFNAGLQWLQSWLLMEIAYNQIMPTR